MNGEATLVLGALCLRPSYFRLIWQITLSWIKCGLLLQTQKPSPLTSSGSVAILPIHVAFFWLTRGYLEDTDGVTPPPRCPLELVCLSVKI